MFKIGDKVTRKTDCQTAKANTVYLVSYVPNSLTLGIGDSVTNLCGCTTEWTLVEEVINNTMNIKEKFITAFLSEPEKTFRQQGITNGDGFLTADGQSLFLSWLLKKFGADFKKEAVDLLVEKDK